MGDVPPEVLVEMQKTQMFTLPGEVLNIIYRYVLQDCMAFVKIDTLPASTVKEWSLQQSASLRGWHRICSGDSNEPALLNVCKAIRTQALPMYYGSTRFCLVVNARQLKSVAQWLSHIRDRFGCKSNKYSPLLGIEIELQNWQWEDIGLLLPIACMARDCSAGFSAVQSQRYFFCSDLNAIFAEVIQLGRRGIGEDWCAAWLEFKFDEWVERKVEKSRITDRRLRPLKRKLPGDWYGTDERTAAQDGGDFVARRHKNSPSDRVLRTSTIAKRKAAIRAESSRLKKKKQWVQVTTLPNRDPAELAGFQTRLPGKSSLSAMTGLYAD